MDRLSTYSTMSHAMAARVIGEYSTSFSAATRLLAAPVRGRIQDVYAIVRLADEVVDGAAAEAGLGTEAVRDRLDRLEQEVLEAMGTGYSVHPVLQAFAETARACSLRTEDVRAFFASMRADTRESTFRGEDFRDYVYGSAEVVGLMCLDVFLAEEPEADREVRREELAGGARSLGAAFQKINFLRDLSADQQDLGRDYMGLATEQDKAAAVADIRADLDRAAAVVPDLPDSSRAGVRAAHGLFEELTRRLERTSLEELRRRRVSVPGPVKARLLARAVADRGRSAARSTASSAARRASRRGGTDADDAATDREGAERAVVVGGGVAGMATAALLGREGYEVTVLERQEQVGGRAGVLEDAGFRWDLGPSWYLMPEAFENFYRLLGTSTAEQLDLVPLRSPSYRVLTGTRPPLDVVSGTDRVAQAFEDIEPGAGRKLRAYLAGAGADYELALSRFLASNFVSLRPYLSASVLRALPRLARLLTESLEHSVARRFRDQRLRQVLGFPAVFLSNRPERTPSLYGLMSHTDLVQGVSYPQGGFGTFVDSLLRLARDEGARVLTGAEATQVLTAPDGRGPGGRRARAAGVAWTDAAGQEHLLPAEVVVSAADLHHTETALVPEGLRTWPEEKWSRRNPGIGCVLAYLGVRGELPELAHHTLVFSEDWAPDFRAAFGEEGPGAHSASVYVSRTSATDPSAAPAGHENLFVLVPVPARAEGPKGGDSEAERIVDAVLEMLGERIGVPDLLQRVVVRHTRGPGDFAEDFHAWRGNALGLAHTLGQSAFFRGSNRSRHVEGLYYAGSTTAPGVGLPMCLVSAENVLKRVRGDRSAEPLAWSLDQR